MTRFELTARDNVWLDTETGGMVVTRPGRHPADVVAEAEIAGPDAPVAQVSMRQARLAMLAAGILDDVEAAIDESDRAVQIEWEYAAVVKRSHPLVAAIGHQLEMSDEQIDELFAAAARIA